MKIGLQNFQSVGAYTEIPIAPIVLFYGPNSAGKSTVVDAFKFLSDTLSGKNRNWRESLERHARRNRTERPLSEKYIGNPHDVVFNIETWRLSEDWVLQVGDFCSKHQCFDYHDWFISHEGVDHLLDNKKLRYQVSFTKLDNKWQMRESLFVIDGQPLFRTVFRGEETNSDGDFETDIDFNIRHPAYQKLEKLNGLIQSFMGGRDLLYETIVDDNTCWLSIHGLLMSDDPFSTSPIDWVRNSYWNENYDCDTEYTDDFRKLREYLDFFCCIPARFASFSCEIKTIPPLRPLPDNPATFEVRSSSAYYELNCWELLADDIHKSKLGKEVGDNNALPFINRMLTSRDFLDTGYIIDGDIKQLSLGIDELYNLIDLDSSSRQQEMRYIPATVHLFLADQKEGYQVEIADVGVGVSQVVPVLYGCWQALNGYHVHIQQPELHLHPKLQAQLGDVFIKSINTSKDSGGSFLLESHSEHLLLRLLRRIRETNQTNISGAEIIDIGKARSRSLSADQVVVVYVKKDKNGLTEMKHLRLAEDGEFLDRWPDGFFAERDKELFGDEEPFE